MRIPILLFCLALGGPVTAAPEVVGFHRLLEQCVRGGFAVFADKPAEERTKPRWNPGITEREFNARMTRHCPEIPAAIAQLLVSALPDVEAELVHGSGERLVAIAVLFGVPPPERPAFFVGMRADFARLLAQSHYPGQDRRESAGLLYSLFMAARPAVDGSP